MQIIWVFAVDRATLHFDHQVESTSPHLSSSLKSSPFPQRKFLLPDLLHFSPTIIALSFHIHRVKQPQDSQALDSRGFVTQPRGQDPTFSAPGITIVEDLKNKTRNRISRAIPSILHEHLQNKDKMTHRNGDKYDQPAVTSPPPSYARGYPPQNSYLEPGQQRAYEMPSGQGQQQAKGYYSGQQQPQVVYVQQPPVVVKDRRSKKDDVALGFCAGCATACCCCGCTVM